MKTPMTGTYISRDEDPVGRRLTAQMARGEHPIPAGQHLLTEPCWCQHCRALPGASYVDFRERWVQYMIAHEHIRPVGAISRDLWPPADERIEITVSYAGRVSVQP